MLGTLFYAEFCSQLRRENSTTHHLSPCVHVLLACAPCCAHRSSERRDGAAEKELTPPDRRRVKFPLVPIPREQHTSSFRLHSVLDSVFPTGCVLGGVIYMLPPGEPHPPKRRRDPTPRALRLPPIWFHDGDRAVIDAFTLSSQLRHFGRLAVGMAAFRGDVCGGVRRARWRRSLA